jgi:hypothetical protein
MSCIITCTLSSASVSRADFAYTLQPAKQSKPNKSSFQEGFQRPLCQPEPKVPTLVKIEHWKIGNHRHVENIPGRRSRSTRAFNPHTLIKTPCSPSFARRQCSWNLQPARPATCIRAEQLWQSGIRGRRVREWWNYRCRPAHASHTKLYGHSRTLQALGGSACELCLGLMWTSALIAVHMGIHESCMRVGAGTRLLY